MNKYNQFSKMNSKKMEIQDNFVKHNDFINDLFHRIEILEFRVLPYSHDLEAIDCILEGIIQYYIVIVSMACK